MHVVILADWLLDLISGFRRLAAGFSYAKTDSYTPPHLVLNLFVKFWKIGTIKNMQNHLLAVPVCSVTLS